jgi:hypothetical protein
MIDGSCLGLVQENGRVYKVPWHVHERRIWVALSEQCCLFGQKNGNGMSDRWRFLVGRLLQS